MKTTFAVLTPAKTGLTLPSIANQSYGSAPVTVSATSTSPALISYKVVSGPARIAASTPSSATIGATGLGIVVVQASQPASGNYAAATTTTTYTVNGQDPLLAVLPIADKVYSSTTTFAVGASSHSPAAIAYAVLSGPAVVSANKVSLTGAGTVILQASQTATGNYAATTVKTTFAIVKQ